MDVLAHTISDIQSLSWWRKCSGSWILYISIERAIHGKIIRNYWMNFSEMHKKCRTTWMEMWFSQLLVDYNLAGFCPCSCRKRQLIKEYKLSYTTTGLLCAWPACMQWCIWGWTVWHWAVLVQVINCFKGRWVIFDRSSSQRGDPVLQPQS